MSCLRNVDEPAVNTGHTGAPGPFGFPVFAKFVHDATIWSDRPISAPCNSRGSEALSWAKFTPNCPPCHLLNTNWMSMVWDAKGWKLPVGDSGFGILGK